MTESDERDTILELWLETYKVQLSPILEQCMHFEDRM